MILCTKDQQFITLADVEKAFLRIELKYADPDLVPFAIASCPFLLATENLRIYILTIFLDCRKCSREEPDSWYGEVKSIIASAKTNREFTSSSAKAENVNDSDCSRDETIEVLLSPYLLNLKLSCQTLQRKKLMWDEEIDVIKDSTMYRRRNYVDAPIRSCSNGRFQKNKEYVITPLFARVESGSIKNNHHSSLEVDDPGEFPEFMTSRVREIQSSKYKYRYVPSTNNPADAGLRKAVSRSPGAETATKKGFSLTVAILSIPWKI
ncbi:unnamed protein product [Enterobius vermicularis]|uniref:Reverse transcriptase domain-containing protein n=1 Tax=Enterobius vermicularis TaxID=51028 RepID=A0A0N4V1S7_ENTVE|nr:unnamed protein product [Enterobius vermicularis]